MGRREDLIRELTSDTRFANTGDLSPQHILAERQVLALEGIEDLLRARNADAGENDAYGGDEPRRPSAETSRALIAATENAVPMATWKKASFVLDGTDVVIGGRGVRFIVDVDPTEALGVATKLADLLNRHWGE